MTGDAKPLRVTPWLVIALLLIAAAAGLGVARMMPDPPPVFPGTALDAAPAAPFALRDVDGRPVTLATFRGAPLLIYFGYTQCPDACPLTLSRLSRALRRLGRSAAGARVLLVTVDPAHDTPAALRQYVAKFGPRVSAATADSAALARVWSAYSVYVAAPQPPAMDSAMEGAAMAGHAHAAARPASPVAAKLAHSGVVYGIDRQGNLRVLISDTATDAETEDDIRTLAGL